MKLSTLNQEDLIIINDFLKDDFPHIDTKNYLNYAELIVARFYLDEAFRNLFEYTGEEKEKLINSLRQPEVETSVIQLVYTTINGVEIETFDELLASKGLNDDDTEEDIFNGLEKDEFWEIVRTKLFERLPEVKQKYIEYSEFSNFGEQINKEMAVANIASYIIIEDIFGCVGNDLPLNFTEAPGVFINEMYDVDFVNKFIEDFIDEIGDRILDV